MSYDVVKFSLQHDGDSTYLSKPVISKILGATFTLRGFNISGSSYYSSIEIMSTRSMCAQVNITINYVNTTEKIDLIADTWIQFNQVMDGFQMENYGNSYFNNSTTIYFLHITDLGVTEFSIKDFSLHWIEILKELHLSQTFSDVVIISMEGTIFKAHKFVLQASSPVFAAMFSVDMIEKDENKVELKDFNENTVKELLSFIYTGTCPNISTVVEDLVYAADHYQLDKLKSLCESKLIKSITTENTIHFYLMADKFHLEKLKKKIVESIKRSGGLKCYTKTEAYLKLSKQEVSDIIENI